MPSQYSYAESSAQGAAKGKQRTTARTYSIFVNPGRPQMDRSNSNLVSEHEETPTPECRAPRAEAEAEATQLPNNLPVFHSFQIVGSVYLYDTAYHDEWVKWVRSTLGYAQFVRKCRDKHVNWDSETRTADIWKQFAQAAVIKSGTPVVLCVHCKASLTHPGTGGTTSTMRDHTRSERCKKLRKETTPLRKIQDVPVPAKFNQLEFDNIFLEGLLAVNLGFNTANNVSFRRIFRSLNQNILIPSPSTLRRRLTELYEQVVEEIRSSIPKDAKVSIAADAWTAPNKSALLGVVAYWIDKNWEMREVLIGFELIKGAHTGRNMSLIVEAVLNRYKITDKLLGFTSDSASNNTTLTRALREGLSTLSIGWDAEQNHIPCMAHIIQLILQAFMGYLNIKGREDVPCEIKKRYIDKVVNMPKGFFKTIEKHRKLAIAVGASPKRRDRYLEIQEGRFSVPVCLIYDVKTRWNSTLDMLERALRMKEITKEWLQMPEHIEFRGLWSTDDEWKQVEYIMEVLHPIRYWTLWMSKSHGITIHRVFEVYQEIFEHLDEQIMKLKNKRMRWKVEIREALEAAHAKAFIYYSGTNKPRGLLLNLGTCLNPYVKLSLYNEWDDDEENDYSDPNSYTATYRQEFIDYYEQNYSPPPAPPVTTSFPSPSTPSSTGRFAHRRNKDRTRATPSQRTISEAIRYIDSPPEQMPDLDHSDTANSGEFWEPSLTDFWRFQSIVTFQNLGRMAKDILAVPSNSVGVERVFNMGRDQLSYRRRRMQSTNMRASMIVKYFKRCQLKESIKAKGKSDTSLERLSQEQDHDHFTQLRKNEDMFIISDDDEEASGKNDTDWSFVDDDGVRALERGGNPNLPPRTLKSYFNPSLHKWSDNDEEDYWDAGVYDVGEDSDLEEEEEEEENSDNGKNGNEDGDGSKVGDSDSDSGGSGGDGKGNEGGYTQIDVGNEADEETAQPIRRSSARITRKRARESLGTTAAMELRKTKK